MPSSRRRRIDFSAPESQDSGLRAEPTVTPWRDNGISGQCSVFDTRPDAPYPELIATVAQSAVQLQIRTWCHGEMRVSLTPRHDRNARLPQGWQRNGRPGYIHKATGVDTHTARRKRTARKHLVRRHESQGDRELISGFGGLPKPSILSRYSARQMEECSEIAVRECGLQGVFLTGTLPGSTDDSFETIARYSGYLVQLVRQWIRDNLDERAHVFGAWEFQKRGALHSHICVLSKDKAGLANLLAGYQRYWRKILVDLSESTGVDCFRKDETHSWIDDERFPRCDAGWLRKSPAKYLGKYCGKEAQKAHPSAKYFPSRWTTTDLHSRRAAIRERMRLVLGGVTPETARIVYGNVLEFLDNYAVSKWSYWSRVFLEDETHVISVLDTERDTAYTGVEAILTCCVAT